MDVFCLPRTLTAQVLIEYLSVKDIVRLDTAMCSVVDFQAIYSEPCFVFSCKRHGYIKCNGKTLVWMKERNIMMGAMTIKPPFNPVKLQEYLKFGGNAISHLDLGLKHHDNIDIPLFKTILRLCPNIRALSGVPKAYVTTHAAKLIRSHCRELESLSVWFDYFRPCSYCPASFANLFGGGFPLLIRLELELDTNMIQIANMIGTHCKNVEFVELSHHGYERIEGDELIAALSPCHCLKNLTLRMIDFPVSFGESFLLVVARSFPHLVTFILANGSGINLSSEVLEALSLNCQELVTLHLAKVESVSRPLSSISFKKLASLHLIGCTLEEPTCVSDIARACPCLVEINLGQCSGLTGRGFESIVSHCPTLKHISIEMLTSIEQVDSALRTLAHSCHDLISFCVLAQCWELNTEILQAISLGCPFLKVLIINPSPYEPLENLTETSADSALVLRNKFARLETVGLVWSTDAANVLMAPGAGCFQMHPNNVFKRTIVSSYHSKCLMVT